MQYGVAYPLLDETMQQLALTCSFASFEPADEDKLPEKLARVWATLSQLPTEHRLGLRDTAQLIDGHLIMKGNSSLPAAKSAEKEPLAMQDVSPDSHSESDEQAPMQQALAVAAKPAKAQDKAAAAASKQAQPQAAAATSNQLQVLADAMRTTPAMVNDGEQRAATKRLQLRNKLKRAHEAAGTQSASQQADLALPTLAAEAEAVLPGAPSSPQAVLSQLNSLVQPEAADSELPALKPSRKMLKRERRRAAAAAAVEIAASTAAQQPDAAGALQVASDGPSTAEGTSSSSAASLAGSEAGTPPAKVQADVVQQGTATDVSDAPSPSSAGDDVVSNSKEGRVAAYDHAASAPDLPAADSSNLPASASGIGTAQADSMPLHPSAVLELTQPDSKAVTDKAESDPTQTSTKPEGSTQESATTGSPAVASAHEAGAPQPLKELQPAAAQISDVPVSTNSSSLASPPPAPQAGMVGSNRKTSVTTGTGNAVGRDTRGQPPLKPDSRSQQKVEQRPSAAAAAAAPPLPPAAIAAHRPAAKKVVLRASAAPYTPLSRKATLADSSKTTLADSSKATLADSSKAMRVDNTKTVATGTKPAASSRTEDTCKKIASGALPLLFNLPTCLIINMPLSCITWCFWSS